MPAHLKTALLMRLLEETDTEAVLVFTRTKHRAKRVGEQLQKAGYRAASLQGNLAQARRQAALDGFRDGKFQILVATDIAARGIDVSSASRTSSTMTCRIRPTPTRTASAAPAAPRDGRRLHAGDRRGHRNGARHRARAGREIARRTVPGFDYNAPAPAHNAEFARPPREPRRVKAAPAARIAPVAPGAGQAPRWGDAPARAPRPLPAPAQRPAAAAPSRPAEFGPRPDGAPARRPRRRPRRARAQGSESA